MSPWLAVPVILLDALVVWLFIRAISKYTDKKDKND